MSTQRVPITTLDNLFADSILGTEDSKLALKVDVQGAEDKVLDGAKQIMDCFSLIQLELSLVSLYENQILFMEMLERMINQGFQLWSLHPNFYEPHSGRLLQFDACFVRTEFGSLVRDRSD